MAERLALLGLLLLGAVAPLASIFASRAIGLLLPVAAALALPYVLMNRAGLIALLRRAFWPLLLACAFLLLAVMQSEAPMRSIRVVLQNLAGFVASVFILYAALSQLPRARLWQAWRIMAAALPVTVFLIAFEQQSGMLLNTQVGYLDGSGTPPGYELDRGTVIASLFVWVLVGGLNLLGRGGVSWLVLLSGALLITFTTSQSAMIGLYAGLLVYFLYPVFPRLLPRVMRLGVLAGFLFMPFLAAGLIAWLGYDNNLWPAASVGQRLAIWGYATVHIFDRPWLGHGLEAMRAMAHVHGHTHNGALQLWLEFGLLGALFAGLGLKLLLKQAQDMPPALARTAHAAFAGWAVVFCVGYGIWQAWWMATSISLVLLFAMLRRFQPAPSGSPSRLPA